MPGAASSPTGPKGPSPHPSAFVTAPPRRVLFICLHNAGFSQMAEAMARTVAPEGTEIWSAGQQPSPVHPLAIQAMKEMGLDLSGQHSKHLDDVPWQEMDTVVVVCGESAQMFPEVGPGVRRVHWPLPDPGEVPESERLTAFREARDEIHWRVSSLWPSDD